jgi:Na+/H+-dicarboxylate symporter
MKHGNLLTLLIIISLVFGCLFGQFVLFDPDTLITNGHWTYQLGNLILIRPLMLMIIPLIFVSVVCGVTSIGDPSRLGVVGGSTVVYYLATMLIAVTIGAVLVTSISPGKLDEETATQLRANAQTQFEQSTIRERIESAQKESKDTLGGVWRNILEQLIPSNLAQEVLEVRPLGVIVTALLFGLALAIGHEKSQPVITFFNALFETIMLLVRWIIWLTPIGVFFLVAWTVGSIGFVTLFGPLVKYILTVIVGLILHGVIVLPLVMYIFTRQNPFRFMWQMRKALMTAFGTDSSSATLPVTIETAENEGGCSKRASNFVLPLGSTINMDGTALYEAVAVSQCSASRAAWQPMPAAVTAWRYSASATSPAAKTPSMLVAL